MEFRILGPLEVLDGGRPVRVPGAKERALLAILLLHAGTVVPADRLVDELWGARAPRNAANALQVRVSQLRRAVGPEALRTRAPGYLLDVDPERIDARRFERLVGAGRFAEALAQWRGPPLAEFADEGFARAEIVRLGALHLTAIEGRIDADLAAGAGAGLVAELEGLVAAHPLRERLRGQLMQALYRAGRQADALEVFRRARAMLAEELGIDPSPELRRVEQAILVQEPELSAPPGSERDRGNLPLRSSSFVGRAAELSAVAELAERHRLVTLTGPGGVGKTALAVEAARVAPDRFRHGVWLAELAPLRDPALLPQAVRAALDVPEGPGARGTATERLVEDLRGKQLLLVLDNCEHLAEAAAELVARLLAALPGVRVIATSREALGLPGEARWPVPPLAGPEAVRLFAERAEAASPAFALDAATAPAVAEICARLDSLPLALELAAARVAALPVAEIAARLDDRFRLLGAGVRGLQGHHETLRAAIDWSHDLLSAAERALFARLAVFSGGWCLDSAERVCDAELDVLLRLVDRSLVIADAGRFRMLETVRAYALERLEAGGEAERFRRRHAAWIRDLAEGGAGAQALEADYDNLRAALDWTLASGDVETALRIGAALMWFWHPHHISEGRERMATLVAAADGDAPSVPLAGALVTLAILDADIEPLVATGSARRGLALYEQLGDRVGAATAKAVLASSLTQAGGDVAEVRRLLDESERVWHDVGDAHGAAHAALAAMLLCLFRLGNLDEAVALGRLAVERFRAVGEQWALAFALWHLALALRWRGDLDEAEATDGEALVHARESGIEWMEDMALTELGSLAALRGDWARADGLHAQAAALADQLPLSRGAAYVANAVGIAARARGDFERARLQHLDALRIHRDMAHPRLGFTLALLGFAEARLGRHAEARDHLTEALRAGPGQPQPHTAALALEGLAALAVDTDPRRAATLLGAAGTLRRGIAAPADRFEQAEIDRTAATAATALGAEAYASALREGATTPSEELPALAL